MKSKEIGVLDDKRYFDIRFIIKNVSKSKHSKLFDAFCADKIRFWTFLFRPFLRVFKLMLLTCSLIGSLVLVSESAIINFYPGWFAGIESYFAKINWMRIVCIVKSISNHPKSAVWKWSNFFISQKNENFHKISEMSSNSGREFR